ncbi:MAG TPA: hypothetical protein VKV35_06830 [Streptosporangiaceae bacterium]|jgi:hypothetical protein|nr:hypothetical protein [Streptosporangiaceae bacterium]
MGEGGTPRAWGAVRAWLSAGTPALFPVRPRTAAVPGAPACCGRCRGPARPGYARCYQCERHELAGHGLLADAVVPVSYAVKGTAFAAALWRYKSCSAPSRPARMWLLALLLAFLHDHGGCVWRHAGMPPPTRLAVVPTGCGRPGPHPLLELAAPYLRLPVTPLAIRPGSQGRDLDMDRFRARAPAGGASVLLLDDTWVSGASVQAAAAALKLAGARHVGAVVLGRHINPAEPRAAALAAGLAPAAYDPAACAVHGTLPEPRADGARSGSRSPAPAPAAARVRAPGTPVPPVTRVRLPAGAGRRGARWRTRPRQRRSLAQRALERKIVRMPPSPEMSRPAGVIELFLRTKEIVLL